jgi:hypothetical protein
MFLSHAAFHFFHLLTPSLVVCVVCSAAPAVPAAPSSSTTTTAVAVRPGSRQSAANLERAADPFKRGGTPAQAMPDADAAAAGELKAIESNIAALQVSIAQKERALMASNPRAAAAAASAGVGGFQARAHGLNSWSRGEAMLRANAQAQAAVADAQAAARRPPSGPLPVQQPIDRYEPSITGAGRRAPSRGAVGYEDRSGSGSGPIPSYDGTNRSGAAAATAPPPAPPLATGPAPPPPPSYSGPPHLSGVRRVREWEGSSLPIRDHSFAPPAPVHFRRHNPEPPTPPNHAHGAEPAGPQAYSFAGGGGGGGGGAAPVMARDTSGSAVTARAMHRGKPSLQQTHYTQAYQDGGAQPSFQAHLRAYGPNGRHGQDYADQQS